jgi:hypothetical protein
VKYWGSSMRTSTQGINYCIRPMFEKNGNKMRQFIGYL